MEERLVAMSPAHAQSTRRFRARLADFTHRQLLNPKQYAIAEEHLFRLAERNRNPANTGNLEDLFCYTLEDTGDPVRAYAQALADSVKVVPMDDEMELIPPIRDRLTGQVFTKVGDLTKYDATDKMLITHTNVAFADPEMRQSARQFVEASDLSLSEEEVEQRVHTMTVQSQHGPSSTFILARMHGLTLDIRALYESAGYSEDQIESAQKFYDVCSEFDPSWAEPFLDGRIPDGSAWGSWRKRYLALRQQLPEELVYQLSSDTLSNFLGGTLESGKWTDAAVYFRYVKEPSEVPAALARIVNQYIAEHNALHDRPSDEFVRAISEPLQPYGVGFRGGRAVALKGTPEKAEDLREQFLDAWARLRSSSSP